MKKFFLAGLISALGVFGTSAFAHGGHQHPDAHLVFSEGIHAHLFWEVGPQEGAESILRIEFMNGADHTPLEIEATPSVSVWMPDMNHGSAPTTIERVVDEKGQPKPGVYRASKIFFIMAGNWDMALTLTNSEGAIETKTLSLMVPPGCSNGDGDHDHHH